MGWLLKLGHVVNPERDEKDLDDELSFHLEMETQQYVDRGHSLVEARRLALRNFGGIEKTKEEVRDADYLRRFENLLQDLTFAIRQFRKRPGFTLLALVTLALGIGANSAIFSLIDGVLLAPLPYCNGHELVRLTQSAPKSKISNLPFSIPELEDYRAGVSSLVDIVEFHSMSFVLLGGEEPQRVQTGVVSDSFFSLLGVDPILGRSFSPEDNTPNGEAVLLLTHDYWEKSFGADRDIIGRLFEMNDRPHRVVGVLPPIPLSPLSVDVFMPSSACPFRAVAQRTPSNRNTFRSLVAMARVRPGFSLEQVNAQLNTVAKRFEAEYPATYGNGGLETRATTLHEELTRQARPTLFLLLVTTGLVLLIACANVANLLLTNWFRRQRETAVRVAIGAGRKRLICQALVESLLLTVFGGLLGLLLAAGGLDLLKAFTARLTPRAGEITINPSVLAFALGLSIVSGVFFALIPVLAVKLEHIIPALKAGRHNFRGSPSRLRGLLIVGQVAVSCVLLISAGLTLHSLLKLQGIDPGYRTENVLSAALSMNWSRYSSPQDARLFFEGALAILEKEPGVLSAAVGNIVPLAQQGPANFSFEIEKRPLQRGEMRPLVDIRSVSEYFFSTIRIPLRRGRLFSSADDSEAAPVAVVSESFATMYWPNDQPLGQRVRFADEPWREIVGIVGDARLHALSADSTEVIYVPLRQGGFGSSFLVRTTSDPSVMERRIKEIVYQLDPQQPLTYIETLDQLRRESIASPRLTTLLFGMFATLALLITLSGISGVIALAVNQRTHEIGIRMALGARQRTVLLLILAQGLKLVLIGLVTGLAVAFIGGRSVSASLYGIEPTDPMTFLIVASLFLAVAMATCLFPARRAITIDPLQALRSD